MRGYEKAVLHQVIRTASKNSSSYFLFGGLITADASF
jgi:hypothetical protein